MKLFLDNFLLLDIYNVEGVLNRHKNDEMVNNYSNSCNYCSRDFKKSPNQKFRVEQWLATTPMLQL